MNHNEVVFMVHWEDCNNDEECMSIPTIGVNNALQIAGDMLKGDNVIGSSVNIKATKMSPEGLTAKLRDKANQL